MTPTWYDLLGVEPDAPADEIRAAWKSAIADLDPGDRRFRTLNEAAEVLLDQDRRAAYDETLAPDDTVADVRGAPAASLGASGVSKPTAITDLSSEKATARAEAKERRAQSKRAQQESRDATPGRTVPAWLLATLAVLTAAALAAAGYLATQPSDAGVADATSQAQGAAERAVTTILAYDYRHLDDDQAAAGELMTAQYKKDKYDPLFAQIKANAPSLKAVVTVQVVASGIVRSGDDRVQVLVFVNRPTLRADKTEPEIFRDQVVVTMVKEGGDWLVDDMDTNKLAG